MRLRFISFLGLASLTFSTFAGTNELSRLTTLSFTEDNRQRIQAMVGDSDTCADLLWTAIAAHEAHVHTRKDQQWTSVRVLGGCKTVFFDHSGNLEVVATADLENGNGALSYVVVFKHSGFLDEADMAIGEGDGALGPIKLFLQDLNHDGHLELIETDRVHNVDGSLLAHVDPAPTVTNIYVWHNNAFVLSTGEFRSYILLEVLPALQKQWEDIRRSGIVSPDREKQTQAIQGSITLANRFLNTGHYFPK